MMNLQETLLQGYKCFFFFLVAKLFIFYVKWQTIMRDLFTCSGVDVYTTLAGAVGPVRMTILPLSHQVAKE